MSQSKCNTLPSYDEQREKLMNKINTTYNSIFSNYQQLSTTNEYAFRIVNDVQRLDIIIQFKLIGHRFIIQQDGRDITSSNSSRRSSAECFITNSHGVSHKYRVFWSERNINGKIIIGTDNSVGQNEERTW